MKAWCVGLTALGASGCGSDCGTYGYKGVQATEYCGQVWGTEGELFEVEGDPELSWAEIRFRHIVPAAVFDFEHQGGVIARVRWSDLISGEELGPEEVYTRCEWIDRNIPLNDLDDVPRDEPAEEVRLRDHGRRFNLDVGNSYVRRLSWEVTCGDGVFRLDAKDEVEFVRQDGLNLPEDLAAHIGLTN